MSSEWPWTSLGLDGPVSDTKEVKRAYAARLREIDADNDIEGFQALRAAYAAGLQKSGQGNTNTHNRFRDLPTPVPVEQKAPEQLPPQPPRLVSQTVRTDRSNERPVPPPKSATSEDIVHPVPIVPSGLQTAEQLLNAQNYDKRLWAALLQTTQEEDSEASALIERLVVNHLEHRSGKLGHISRAWFELLDDRYDWVDDLVGFLQRHPEAQNLHHAILQRFTSTPTARRVPPNGKPVPFFVFALAVFVVLAWAFHLLTRVYI